jgi:hypothetical protein
MNQTAARYWNLWALVIPVLLGVLGAFAFLAAKSASAPIYGPFQHIYADHFGRRLGAPVGNYQPSPKNVTYQGVFENGTHVWSLNGFYVMFADGHFEKEVENWTPDGDWQDEKALEDKFKPYHAFDRPKGPPFGTLAYLWAHNPDHYSKLGGREWQCGTEPNVVTQDFENGRIIGVLRNRAAKDWDAGLVYVLFFKDGDDRTGQFQTATTIDHTAPDSTASACTVP